MKFDKQKAFPYPVLRPESDDFVGIDFQATVDLVVGKEKVEVSVSYVLSSAEISALISEGRAEYTSIISCRDTYYQAVLSSADKEAKGEFSIGELRGEIKIEPFVFVRKEIEAFVSPDINPEFSSGSFRYSIGDVLAQDEPQIFYIDRDLFKPVTSVFDLVKRDDLKDGSWAIGFSDDHVQIEVSPYMKEAIDDARNSNHNRVILFNSIYFGCRHAGCSKAQGLV